MKKKALSLILALTLIFGILPMSAFADEPNAEPATDIINIIDDTVDDPVEDQTDSVEDPTEDPVEDPTEDQTDDPTDNTTNTINATNGSGMILVGSGDGCTCNAFCDDPDCVVCKDDPTQCFFYDVCICEAVCAEGEANPACPVCKDDYSKCAQAVTAPQIAPMVATPGVTVIPVDSYVTPGNGKITISGVPSDGIYIYMVYPSEWSGWQNTTQGQTANMSVWTIWTESVDRTTDSNGTALNNGTPYYVYIAKVELVYSQYQMRSLGEAVVTPTIPTPPAPSSGGGSSKKEKPAPAPSPWLAPTPAQNMSSDAKQKDSDLVRTKSSDLYGVRKDAWQKLKNYRFVHDTMDGDTVGVRVSINEPEKIKQDLLVSGYAKGASANSRKAQFEKWFNNKIHVIHFDQNGAWGQPVEIAAKIDPNQFDSLNNLFLYSYDKNTKKYTRIERQSNHWLDNKGYLHFTTELAGDIIISEGPLEKK